MPREFIVRGLPTSIAQDGWWLNTEVDRSGESVTAVAAPLFGGQSVEGRLPKFAGMVLLILLGDFLFWGYAPGLSLAIFAWGLFAVVAMGRPAKRRVLGPVILLVLATLPTIEHVQLLSVCLLGAGLLAAVAWLRVPAAESISAGRDWFMTAFMRLVKTLPTSGVLACASQLRNLRVGVASGGLIFGVSSKSLLRNWAFPIGGTLVLGALLIGANPVLEQTLSQVLLIDLDALSLARRAVFWSGLGVLIWPLLTAPTPSAPLNLTTQEWRTPEGLNTGSVLRALVLFNLLLALQSVMDFSILFGGAALPEGMSYATYAHRGAYPLLVTAMLAGAFAVAARPFLSEHKALKPLLLLWLLQNVFLTLSAALRLDLYIDAFGLTYLRLYALIWMALVAIGLLLVGWQVLRGRSSLWLMLRACALGFGTLYACAFVNFAAVIATDMLDRGANLGRSAAPDWHYLCNLGPMASKAIAQGMDRNPDLWVPQHYRACLQPDITYPNWREWGFRTGRINGYFAGDLELEATRHENSVGG